MQPSDCRAPFFGLSLGLSNAKPSMDIPLDLYMIRIMVGIPAAPSRGTFLWVLGDGAPTRTPSVKLSTPFSVLHAENEFSRYLPYCILDIPSFQGLLRHLGNMRIRISASCLWDMERLSCNTTDLDFYASQRLGPIDRDSRRRRFL